MQNEMNKRGNQQQQQQIASIPAYDSNWVETTSKKAQLKLEKLDTDLKSAKSLAIKDCIRRGQEDLAEHYMEMGDLANALKCHSRSRDYCSSNKHIINLCLNVIKVILICFRSKPLFLRINIFYFHLEYTKL